MQYYWEFAFWHPFGSHGGEGRTSIIERKRREIEANGWTLWSFQYRTLETLSAWYAQVRNTTLPVYVFCSDSPGAVDPEKGETSPECHSYAFIDGDKWFEIPNCIRVPHPFNRRGNTATAFIVRSIVYPLGEDRSERVSWYEVRKATWRTDRDVPTRGEYLLRANGSRTMRRRFATLELRAPYIARVALQSPMSVPPQRNHEQRTTAK